MLQRMVLVTHNCLFFLYFPNFLIHIWGQGSVAEGHTASGGVGAPSGLPSCGALGDRWPPDISLSD